MPSQSSESLDRLSTEAELLDSRTVSLVLGLGRTKVFELMAGGQLPVLRIGRSVRVPRQALFDWIRNQTIAPQPAYPMSVSESAPEPQASRS